MKIILWNINGLRAIIKKIVKAKLTFEKYLINTKADIICFNETKISEDNMALIEILKEYKYTFHAYSTIKKGYSGVSIYSKIKPLHSYYLDNDLEGRIVCLEFDNYILINVYQPNSGTKLNRLSYRIDEWSYIFQQFINKVKKINKYMIITGDMNVAHTDLDIKYPEKHKKTAGCTEIEQSKLTELLETNNLIDAWRYHYPQKIQYSYFDYRSRGRDHNRGFRLDYFLISKKCISKVKKIKINSDVYGSDHLPVILNIDL